MRLRLPLAVLLSMMFIVPPAASAPAQQLPVKEWTLIIWLDADNNLEGAGVHDMNEMETVGSTDDINIVVQMDRAEGYDTTNGDWTGTKRYYVTKDGDMATIGSKELADLGEVNMGDPANVINFTTWAIKNYPARHYLFDFWDHGGGFHGVCWDDKDKDNLDLYNVTESLEAMKKQLGRPVDLVGMDCCLMSGIEILYALKGTCNVAALSGTTEPNDGWPYDWILPALAMKPTMSPKELATEITQDYVNSYTDGKPDPQDTPTATMAAWDMRMVPNIFEQFDQLAMRLALKAFTWNAFLREVRANTQGYDPGHVAVIDVLNYPLYDIYDMCKEMLKPYGGPVMGFLLDDGVKQNLDYTMNDILGARVAERHGPQFPDAYGLTAYWPSGNTSALAGTPKTQYDARYDRIAFSKEQFWDDFLKAYVDMQNLPNTPPYVTIGFPVEDSKLDAAGGPVQVTGTAFDANAVSTVQVRVDSGKWRKASGTNGWEYKWDISKLSGKHTFSAMASDGITDSQVVSQTYDIKAAPSIGGQNPLVVYAGVGAVMVIGAVAGVLWMRRKGLGVRDILGKLKPSPAKEVEAESD